MPFEKAQVKIKLRIFSSFVGTDLFLNKPWVPSGGLHQHRGRCSEPQLPLLLHSPQVEEVEGECAPQIRPYLLGEVEEGGQGCLLLEDNRRCSLFNCFNWGNITLQANETQIWLFLSHTTRMGLFLYPECDKSDFFQIRPKLFQYVVLKQIHIWRFSKQCSLNVCDALHPTFTPLTSSDAV